MKHSRLLKYLLCFLFLGQHMSCKKSDDTLTKVFNQTELKTIDKMIQYFDDYVVSQTSNQLQIDKAYISYLGEMHSSMGKADNDINKFLPTIEERIVFYQNLDTKVLSEIYEIKDTITYFWGGNEPRKIYSPYSFDLNFNGKYVAFLKELSSQSDFFKNYYDNIQASGDISPVNYAMIMVDNNKIDFTNKAERFVVIVNLLRTGKTIKFNE